MKQETTEIQNGNQLIGFLYFVLFIGLILFQLNNSLTAVENLTVLTLYLGFYFYYGALGIMLFGLLIVIGVTIKKNSGIIGTVIGNILIHSVLLYLGPVVWLCAGFYYTFSSKNE